MLHITNGGSAGKTIENTGIGGTVIAWDDVLHEGPVPAGLSLDTLREVRARFIAERGWAPYASVIENFMRRDKALQHFSDHDEIVLWFEHDLYDQLQLIQILDWLGQQTPGPTKFSLICIGEFPGKPDFHGLGELNVNQMASLFPARQPISAAQLDLGRRAWLAFSSPDPLAIEQLLVDDTSALPFLSGALIRHCEQFPSVENGLSRTERQILHTLNEAPSSLIDLFQADQQHEERPFLGDTTYWDYLRGLSPQLTHRTDGTIVTLPDQYASPREFLDQQLEITAQGRSVLQGNKDWLALHPLDSWRGGVHLNGSGPVWRWDTMRRGFVRSNNARN
jgi:hypothetical protein